MEAISVTHTVVAILHDPQSGLCGQLQFLVRSEFSWDAYKIFAAIYRNLY